VDVPEVRYARTPAGLHIAYNVFGEGPIQVLTAGGPAGHIEVVWEHERVARYFERLGSFATVCTFDRRGTGLSDPAEDPPTLEQHMEDLATVANALGWERPALLGNSDAGRMCLLYAATFPENVSKLILNGCVPMGAAVILPAIREQLETTIEERWGRGDLVEIFEPSRADDPRAREWWGRMERMTVGPGMARKIVDFSICTDVRPILPSVRVPTLVAHRADDAFAPVAEARAMAEQIPGATFAELPGPDNVPWGYDQDALLDAFQEFLTGAPPQREPDRVLATVLITDIVGSTGHAARLGDARWREVLAAHFDTTTRTLERHRGRQVKTVGDGVIATFDGPARAIRCARELSGQLRGEGLSIRAALHTGEIELVPGDVSGLAVDIANRIADIASGDEVWVSRTVRDLVVGSELSFAPRGEQTLEGVPDTWELFAAS
jgi:class 3 adenylate cyclase